MKVHEGQHVTLTGTFTTRGHGDLITLDAQLGTVTDVGGTLANVELADGTILVINRTGDNRITSADTVLIDLSTWTRLVEVDEMAAARGIDRAEAIRLLVNSGLSHR